MTLANSHEHDAAYLSEYLDQLAATTPLATAVVLDEAATLTYADLRYQVAVLSLALRRRGVLGRSTGVALLLPNRAELVVALFACLRDRSGCRTDRARSEPGGAGAGTSGIVSRLLSFTGRVGVGSAGKRRAGVCVLGAIYGGGELREPVGRGA